jgi:hypothetical protein
MKQIKIPVFLHDVLGERQSLAALISILLFGGVLTTVIFLRFPEMYQSISLWQRILAFILVFDIFSGCIANFTVSTSNFYAANKGKRIGFIAIHFHILLVALLLGTNIWHSFLVWFFTIASALVVNAIRGRHQLFIGGLLLSVGLAWIPMLYEIETYMLIISLLFMLKVLFSFSVNHYGEMMETSGDGS